jgi:hypothetical protein
MTGEEGEREIGLVHLLVYNISSTQEQRNLFI